MTISTGQFCDNIPLSPWENATKKTGLFQQLPAADVLNSKPYMALVCYPFFGVNNHTPIPFASEG